MTGVPLQIYILVFLIWEGGVGVYVVQQIIHGVYIVVLVTAMAAMSVFPPAFRILDETLSRSFSSSGNHRNNKFLFRTRLISAKVQLQVPSLATPFRLCGISIRGNI